MRNDKANKADDASNRNDGTGYERVTMIVRRLMLFTSRPRLVAVSSPWESRLTVFASRSADPRKMPNMIPTTIIAINEIIRTGMSHAGRPGSFVVRFTTVSISNQLSKIRTIPDQIAIGSFRKRLSVFHYVCFPQPFHRTAGNPAIPPLCHPEC